uniref:RIMS-binding protein 2 n=1 Tax=Gouania willdenowi TaxID=441366 RepID=A0A8C5HF49_GOUWI
METQGEAEAEERQQQHEPGELKRKEYKKHRQPEKTFSTTVKITSTSLLGKRHSLYADLSGFEVEAVRKDGTDYGFLLCQNAGLLRALEELEEKCTTLREENVLLRKSTAPGMEEKVRRLRRKNAELAVLAKRLEERARKLQEANLKVVSSPSLIRLGSVEHYKRAFARQRACDLAHHALVLLSKDKEIASLQQECRALKPCLGIIEGFPASSGGQEFEKLLQESQKEVLRLQRQISVTSSKQAQNQSWGHCDSGKSEESRKEQKENKKSQLEDERSKNEQLKKEADLLRRKAQLLDQVSVGSFLPSQVTVGSFTHLIHISAAICQTRAKNEELREELSEVTAQHISVLEENKKLCAKLENLDQVLKHMREVAERRQQLELEHEQALAILKFKQDEIKRLQRAQLFAKREHEGVVQMLEVSDSTSKVRELEEKCRSQSEQFGLLSQELENFRLQASKVDLATSDVAAALRMGATPHAAGLSRVERSLVAKHRELPTISVCKSGSASSKSDTTHLTPKSDTHHIPHKSSLTHEVDTASEVEELDIDIASAPYTVSRGAAKLQVFIARYSYNPYDGPNDNPEVELPLTAGEYIYVYGDMDDDGFYEGELMDGQRGLVPSNFVDRVSDDDVMSTYHPETGDMSHNSLLDSSLHSATHQQHLHTGVIASERTEALTASSLAAAPSDQASAFAVPAPLTNGLDLDLEEVGVDIVPYPRKLTLIKQLAKSIIIGWDPPLVPAGWGNVWSYNVYVDQELRLNVPFGSQTKAVLERLDINLKAYRVSVQSLTEKGLSDQLCCSMLVGRDVCVAPTQLCVERVTATSANLSWLPSNSNYVHIVSLNEEECELVKAGCYSLCLNNLLPSLQYMVKLEARPHRTPWELPVERREHRSTTITFTTLMAGTPDAPLDVQLERGPSPGIALVSWLPVTIDAAGTSNGVRVTGYTIYADKKKVLEVSSPTAGSVLLGPSQIHSLQAAQALTVRTTSVHSESCDSLSVNVPSKLAAIMSGSAIGAPAVPGYARGLVEPPRDYLGDISRSDLSDILEEEEEDLYSDRLGETQARGYSVGANRVKQHLYKSETPDSEKDVVERIISLPTQVYCSNQLFSIPEVTEEEDSLHEELLSHSGQPQPISTNLHLRNTEHPKHAAQHWLHNLPNPLTNISSHHHFTRDPRYQNKEYLSRQGPVQDVSLYEGPNSRQVSTCCPNQMTPHSKDRGLLRGLGDRLRREAMLRSQMTAAMLTNSSHGFTPPRSYPISKTVHTLRSPVSRQLEVDVEYGADDNDGTEEYNSGEVVVEQMSSEWWVEGAQVEQSKTPHRRRPKADLLVKLTATSSSNNNIGGGLHSPSALVHNINLVSKTWQFVFLSSGNSESTKKKDDGEMRIFVALFPYDPVSMSPNPDAAEEELPFREGQIIKIHGDKDADGFYRGESGGRHGYVPCNMVSEIQVEDPETRQQLLQQGFLSTAASMEKLGPAAPPQEVNAPLGARRMVAIFDYDPRESSPNTDIEAELTFSAGDIIQVFGEMDDDGFFNVSIQKP